MTSASFAHHHHQQQQQSPPSSAAQQHFVGIPLQVQAPPPSGYNLWTPATVGGGARAGVSAVLSLSSREAPPVTVAALVGCSDEGRYLGVPATSQWQVVLTSKYLKAAQELLDEVVSVSKVVVDDASKTVVAAAKSLAAAKEEEDCEGISTEDSAGTRSGSGSGSGAAELSTAERQELQTKKSKLINMLDEVRPYGSLVYFSTKI
jgi:hypothetical protein